MTLQCFPNEHFFPNILVFFSSQCLLQGRWLIWQDIRGSCVKCLIYNSLCTWPLVFTNDSLKRPVELFTFFEGEDNFITLCVVLEFTWLLTGVEGAWSWVKHGKVVESWQIYMWFVRQDVVYEVFHLDDYVLIWVLVAQPGCHTYVWFAASV